MADGLPRFCIFGDSHYACLKQAENQGLVDISGVELEHWGHVGGRFLNLEHRDGVIHPKDEFTAKRFAKFNEKGRAFLPAADFDVILVMGARTYVTGLIGQMLRWGRKGGFASRGLKTRHAKDHLHRQLGYKLALGLAETNTAHVLMAPTSFPTARTGPDAPPSPDAALVSAEDRGDIWRILQEAAAMDGITLVPQPEATVTEGLCTSTDFAVADHVSKRDYVHRNAAYGALILAEVMPIVRGISRRG
jgi:hypothetical protein